MTPLDSHVEVLSALRLGWVVRAVIETTEKLGYEPKVSELTVHDARLLAADEAIYDGEWQVLTLQGWRTPTRCWAITAPLKPTEEQREERRLF